MCHPEIAQGDTLLFTKEIKMTELKASDVLKVKNFSDRAINLSKGRIEPGKTGEATRAELQCHSKSIEIAEKAPSPEQKKSAPIKKDTAKKETNSLI